MAEEQLILVNEKDEVLGRAGKQEVHEKALLHRAFSVFIFRDATKSELLLQQRQLDKYHCGGLWTNSCCSHPRPGEKTEGAAKRRLFEELGIQVDLTHRGVFQYRAEFDNGLTEHEVDHVFEGFYHESVNQFNPKEVHAVEWVAVEMLQRDLLDHPEKYTPWLLEGLKLALV